MILCRRRWSQTVFVRSTGPFKLRFRLLGARAFIGSECPPDLTQWTTRAHGVVPSFRENNLPPGDCWASCRMMAAFQLNTFPSDTVPWRLAVSQRASVGMPRRILSKVIVCQTVQPRPCPKKMSQSAGQRWDATPYSFESNCLSDSSATPVSKKKCPVGPSRECGPHHTENFSTGSRNHLT